MKRAILVVGLLAALLTMAFEVEKAAHAKVPFALDEGAQLGSAYPQITQWPEPVRQVGIRPHPSPGE